MYTVRINGDITSKKQSVKNVHNLDTDIASNTATTKTQNILNYYSFFYDIQQYNNDAYITTSTTLFFFPISCNADG